MAIFRELSWLGFFSNPHLLGRIVVLSEATGPESLMTKAAPKAGTGTATPKASRIICGAQSTKVAKWLMYSYKQSVMGLLQSVVSNVYCGQTGESLGRV
ncbi:MAG: hypothetical protein ACI92E_001889 [Oceanicoccus sp.]|jgi:hypothetical protein